MQYVQKYSIKIASIELHYNFFRNSIAFYNIQGVCGTTVAFRLQEQFGNSVSITIFSDEFSPNTTGDVSAGLWSQYNLGDTPTERAV